jgi:DNA repair protein RadC
LVISLNRTFCTAHPCVIKIPGPTQSFMVRKRSSFEGDSYRGYRVSIRLVRKSHRRYEPVSVTKPGDVYSFMSDLRHSDRERFYSLLLDARNAIVNCEEVSSGSTNTSIVHPREVFKSALLSSCTSIILVHNHPSGNPEPSFDDEKITRRLYERGDLLGIEILDSIIIGDDSYYSFKEAGKMEGYKGKREG